MDGTTVLLRLKELLNEFIYDMIDTVFTYGDVMLSTFKWIAFIGVLIKILYNFYYSPNDYWGYISWLPLAALLFHYDVVVIAFFEWSKELDNRISVLENFEKTKHFFESTELDYEENSMFQIGMTILTDIIKSAIFEGVVRLLLFLGFIGSMIAYFYLKIKMFFKLLILTLFGPLNISLSFLNEFKGNYIGWLTKLIEVCTYIPLIYLVDYIGVEMLDKVFSPRVISSGSEMAETLTRQVLGIIFYVGVIFMYLSIPGLVKYALTQGAAAVGNGKKVAAMAMLAARKVMTGGV